MSTFVQMFLIRSFLSGILADVDTSCDEPRCTQTKLIKANESQSITLLPCDYCKAKDCFGRQIIRQAWWSRNHSQIHSHHATNVTETSYSINLGAILVPQETIFTAYKYSCSESVRYHEMWDIKVIVIPVSDQLVVPQDNGDIAGSRDSVHTGIHPPRHAGFAPSDQLSLHPALQHSPVPSSRGSSSNHSLEAAEVGDGEKAHLVSPRPKRSMSGAHREDEQPATYGAAKVTN